MSWTYTDTADQVIAITECTNELVGAHIGINARDGRSVIVCIPADKRRNAAEAVAGPDYRVVPRDLTVGDLAQIARDAGVQLDMDVQESEPTGSEIVTVSWHDTVLIGPAIHAAKMLADSEDGGGITISEDGEALARLPLPKRRGARLNLARLITPDGWTIVPSESATNAAAMQEDLRAILDALGLSTASRPYSPHECVQRDVLPAIERLKSTANMPEWERELLAGQGYEQEIVALKRERDDLQERLARAAVQAAGEYGPADIARAKADALHAFADTMDRLPDDWILIRRDYGSEVTVEDLLRQTADRYVEQPYPILTQIRVDPKQPGRPEPVDPASVRVGDVVEIKTPLWRIEATVSETEAPAEHLKLLVAGERWYRVTGTTVRVLQPAEPEPDEAAVEALRQAIKDCRDDELGDHFDEPRLALALAKRNVRVVSTDAD